MSVQKTDLISLLSWAENNDYIIPERDKIEKIILTFEEDEKKLIYSNDSVIDMIIGFINNHTWNQRIGEFLENVKVENVWSDYAARSYPKKHEGYYSEISKVFLKTIQHVSSVAGLYFVNALYPEISMNGASL